MNKSFTAILVGIIVIIGGIFIFTKKENSTGSNAQPTQHIVGAGNKKVTLIEYGDFQCPACGAFYPIVEQVREKYGDDITFQFRNYPLTQIHPNAFAAHRAAEAAEKQGKFWEMYNQLYQGQSSWSNLSSTAVVTVFDGYAQSLGLDLTQFKADYASQAISEIINADIAEGQKLGATSTPTFVVNGKKLDNNPDGLDAFNKVIDDAIAAANPAQ